MVHNQVVLAAPAPNGGTQREALALVRPDDERLITPDLSPYDDYILWVFWQVSRDRPHTFSGPGAITLRSLVDYQSLYKDELNEDDIFVLQRLDHSYLKAVASLQKDSR